ncbi:hypothetical protein [Sulfuricurvum sp.]|uniref:hypothetical protein n=1 Tax=Sulfuricurvum sp. TaxID=2025608 RepID=UPI003569E89A
MTTMDKKVMKDPKRLCRMPYSPHCNRENYLSGRHCYPLTMEQSLKWQIKEITDYAYNPEVIIPEVQGKMMTLTQLVDYLNVDFEQVEQEIEFAPTNRKDVGQIQDDETQLLLCMLDKMKPCIANNLRTINPDHDMRFAFAVWMKRLGKTREDAERHYVNIGKHFGYVDLHNEDERRVQFDNIFNNDYKYEPSCNTIIRNGFCIAEKCDRFHSAWKGHEHKRLATK